MAPSVFHVSDVHIRAGGRERCRADEYERVIEGTIGAAERALEGCAPGERLVVVTGDVFHDKGSVGKAGIELFFRLLKGLSRAAPVIIIRGNHDYVQERFAPGDEHTDTGDVIEALLAEAPVEGVTYSSSTGLTEYPPFGLGVLCVQDCSSKGGTCSNDVTVPRLPDPAGFSDRVAHRIALFHGTVPGGAVTARWLSGYDAAMLGDVHERGAWRSPDGRALSLSGADNGSDPSGTSERSWPRGECAWAYAGSLTQQNHGEVPFSHGGLLWDFGSRSISAIDVGSPHAFLSLWRPSWPSRAELGNDSGEDGGLSDADGWMVCSGGISSYGEPLAREVRLSAYAAVVPERVTARVFAPVDFCGCPEAAAISALKSIGCKTCKATVAHCGSGGGPPRLHRDGDHGPGHGLPGGERSGADDAPERSIAESFHSPEAWASQVCDAGDPSIVGGFPYREWLRSDYEALRVRVPPQAGLSWGLPLAKLDERNDKIRRASAAALECPSLGSSPTAGAGAVLSLTRLEWRWMLCYGSGSSFDFSRARGRVVMINGPNASGKSSFLEVISLALFGESPPTRSNKEHAASFINRRTPSGGNGPARDRPCTELVFSVGGVEYALRREFRRKKGTPGKLGAGGAWLTRRSEEVRSGKPAVDKWVSENVGDLGSFLMSTMVSQDRDSDFFAMKPSEQRDVIDTALNADGMSRCLDSIDESRRAHKWTADLLETAARSRELSLPTGTKRGFVQSGRAVAEARRRTGAAVADLWGAAVLHSARARRLDHLEALSPTGVGSGPEPPEPEGDVPRDNVFVLLADARAAIAEAKSELEKLSSVEPDAVPLEESRAERAHFATRASEASSHHLRKESERFKAIAEKSDALRRLLAEAESLEAHGPFSDGCPSCEARRCRASSVFASPATSPPFVDGSRARSSDRSGSAPCSDALRREIIALDGDGCREKYERISALVIAADLWESADPGWTRMRASRRKLMEYIAKRRDMESDIRAKESVAASLEAAAARRRAWEARTAWLTATAADGNPTLVAELTASRDALTRSLSLRSSAMKNAAAARRDLRVAQEQRAAAVARRISRSIAAEGVEAMREASSLVRKKEAALAHVHAVVTEYGESTYRSAVARSLEKGVGSVLGCMGVRDLALRVEWGQKGFSFAVTAAGADESAGTRLPLEKASGYQRASLGLALRIALSRIGASSVRCNQLFLDEAFGSFDERNRGGVGDFLKGLLATYSSVFLVSHVLPDDVGDDGASLATTSDGDALLVY